MNVTNGDGLDLTYYNIDFFGGPSKKTNHLINDENTNIDWCYFIYQLIYYYFQDFSCQSRELNLCHIKFIVS